MSGWTAAAAAYVDGAWEADVPGVCGSWVTESARAHNHYPSKQMQESGDLWLLTVRLLTIWLLTVPSFLGIASHRIASQPLLSDVNVEKR